MVTVIPAEEDMLLSKWYKKFDMALVSGCAGMVVVGRVRIYPLVDSSVGRAMGL